MPVGWFLRDENLWRETRVLIRIFNHFNFTNILTSFWLSSMQAKSCGACASWWSGPWTLRRTTPRPSVHEEVCSRQQKICELRGFLSRACRADQAPHWAEGAERHSDKIVAKRSLELTTSSEEQKKISINFLLFNTEKFYVTSFSQAWVCLTSGSS